MNLSALTAKEVVRICQPETELEKRLFEINQELLDEAYYAKESADQLKGELEDSVSQDDFDDIVREIESVISEIESGKIEKAKTRLANAIRSWAEN